MSALDILDRKSVVCVLGVRGDRLHLQSVGNEKRTAEQGKIRQNKNRVRHPDAPCQDPQTIAICTTGRSPSERSVFLCWRCDGPVLPAKASSRLRSNKSPSGAFERPNGLALARWRGLRPDKLGGICDKGYHGMRRASSGFCKFYCSKAVIVRLIGFGELIRDMDDNSC